MYVFSLDALKKFSSEKEKVTVDDRWVRKTNRLQVIFILLSFFVPVHSRFSAPSLPDSVFQGWCVPVWSQERMIVACAPSLSLSLPLPLSLSLSLSRERMSVSRLLTRPPLPFSLCHWHLLPPLSHVLFSLFKNIPVISPCFCLFLLFAICLPALTVSTTCYPLFVRQSMA